MFFFQFAYFFLFFKKNFSQTFNNCWELSHKRPIARSTSKGLYFKSNTATAEIKQHWRRENVILKLIQIKNHI